MSDLANSCEYLNIDKTCTAFSDNPKAQASRQLKCQNNEKNICCYICSARPQCTISCKYLGQTVAYSPSKLEAEKTPVYVHQEVEVPPVENVPVSFCFSCNTEMSWTKTRFPVGSWRGQKPSIVDSDSLPVIIYLCSKCGKIEFKADITTNKERQ